jgi:predicted transcriptional regulator
MERALEKSGGNKSIAAKMLNISPQAVHQYFRDRGD